MMWWITLFTKHKLSKFLAKITLVYLLVLSLVFLPMGARLLILIAIGTVAFCISFIYYHIALLKIKKLGVQPNIGTYGYWITSGTGLVFSSVILLPSLQHYDQVAQAPVALLSQIWLAAFFYHVFAFYLVGRAGLEILNKK